jgi:hypothetical protein
VSILASGTVSHPEFSLGTGRKLEARSQLVVAKTSGIADQRRHPRFTLDVAIRIYPRNRPVIRGNTVDISESGISAMLREEVAIGEIVRLEFSLPMGDVELLAMVRHRTAFRYGLQFLEAGSAQSMIGRTCRQLSVSHDLRASKSV